MTSVFIERDGDRYTLTCKGHADSAELCAAVSTLVYTLAGYLHNIPCEIEEEKIESGDVRIVFISDDPGDQIAFDMIRIGFLQLAYSYKDSIVVCVQEIE